MSQKFAIDFGTTNSVIACWDEAAATGRTLDLPPLDLPTESGACLIPSLLYVRDGRSGDILIGQEVRRQGLDREPGNRLFRNFKRTIGAESILESRLIDGAPWTEEQAGQAFLRSLLASLPSRLQEIEQLVITVPVAAFEGYTAWLSHSLEGFPAGKIRMVDESTAAALGYAVTEPGAMVMVIDFGGGTLDLSLVRLPESREKTGRVLFSSLREQGGGKAQVIAKAGVSLGGSDIDQWILQEMLRREALPPEALGAAYPGLLSECERAKIELSTRETAILEHANVHQTLSRGELEALMAANGFYDALKQSLEKVMGLAHQKGVYREDLRHVLLIGGTSLIPSVQQTLDEFFRAVTRRQRKAPTQMPAWPAATWSIENTSIRVDKPFTAVVEGALRVAAGFGLEDQLAHGYGLRILDENGQLRFDEILPRGSAAPSQKSVRVELGASRAGQEAVEFVIGQIDTDAVGSVEVRYDGGQTYFMAQSGGTARKIVPLNLGRPLTVSLNPRGKPGAGRLRAEFRVDSMRQLRLSVTDLETHQILLTEAVAAAFQPAVPTPEGKGDPARSTEGEKNGREPCLAKQKKARSQWSLRGLASRLNLLPPDQISVEAYAAALRSDDCMVRFNAADTLARRGDREARLVFEDVLQNGTPHQRASAAGHLYRFSWFAAEPLYRRALADDDPRVGEAAIFALCRMRLPEAYALVIEILPGGSDALRLAAAWGLYSRPDPAAVPVLAVVLEAGTLEIRELALEVLGATENPAGIPLVRSALDDPRPEVLYAATLSWIELAGETCFADLADLIARRRGTERRAILRGFFHATNYMGIETGSAPGIPLVIQALRLALEDDLPETRLSAFLPLCWIRCPEAEACLLDGFHREPNSDVKARMLASAVNLMSPMSGRLLEESLADPDPLLRQTAEHFSS